jgi:hypothetical protein
VAGVKHRPRAANPAPRFIRRLPAIKCIYTIYKATASMSDSLKMAENVDLNEIANSVFSRFGEKIADCDKPAEITE